MKHTLQLWILKGSIQQWQRLIQWLVKRLDKHNAFDDKNCWMNLVIKRDRKKKNHTQIVSVYLDHHIVAPVNDTPLIPIPYSSNNALHCSQIDNLINTRSFVVVTRLT